MFTLDAKVLIEGYVEGVPPAGIDEIHREVALRRADHAAYNRDELSKRLFWFTAAPVGFLIEIIGIGLVILDVTT